MALVNLNGRTIAELESEGYFAAVVERYDHYVGRRFDLFGLFDILAVGHGHTLAVQITSRGNMASRRRKILDSEAFAHVAGAGWRVELWGWDQPRGRGTRYRYKREVIVTPDLENEAI